MSFSAITTILRAPSTIFTFKELALLLGMTNPAALQDKIHYYVKTGALYPVRKGIYAKDQSYNPLELATKIYTPAYISFETVLAAQGVIFQFYKPIFVASYLSREIQCDHHNFIFKKIKQSVLTNMQGVSEQNNVFIADKERAFLDIIYLNKEYYFDNLNSIDWSKCFNLVEIYENTNMEKRLKKYYKESQDA